MLGHLGEGVGGAGLTSCPHGVTIGQPDRSLRATPRAVFRKMIRLQNVPAALQICFCTSGRLLRSAGGFLLHRLHCQERAPQCSPRRGGLRATGPVINQGKTAFVEEFLAGHHDAEHRAVNAAWKAAGNEGTASESLVSKARSRRKLTGRKGPPGGTKKATSGAASKAEAGQPKGEKGQATSKGAGAVGSTAKGPNKTAFIRERLGRDGTLDATAISRAWAEARNEGSISDNLYDTTKAGMGIEGRRTGSTSCIRTEGPPWATISAS